MVVIVCIRVDRWFVNIVIATHVNLYKKIVNIAKSFK